MKRNLFLLVAGIIATLFSCQKEENVFKLTGEIQGLNDTTISLYGIFSIPDSIIEIPVKGGQFSCTLPIDTITPMYLLIQSQNIEYPIFADKGIHIKVEGDTTNLHALHIVGGKAQEEYNAFKDSIASLTDYVSIREEADSFIVKHPQSIVSIYLIQKYFVQVPYPNKDLIESMIKQLSGIMHDNHYISRLQNSLKFRSVREQYIQMDALPDTVGKQIPISEYKNHFVVLSFWASWHPESVRMQDSLQHIIKRFTNRPVKFVSLSVDNDRQQWLDTIRTHKLGGYQLCDFKGWNNTLVQASETNDLPAIYILNTSNKILATDMWHKQLENFLEKQLDKWEEQEKEKKKKEQSKSKTRIKAKPKSKIAVK